MISGLDVNWQVAIHSFIFYKPILNLWNAISLFSIILSVNTEKYEVIENLFKKLRVLFLKLVLSVTKTCSCLTDIDFCFWS